MRLRAALARGLILGAALGASGVSAQPVSTDHPLRHRYHHHYRDTGGNVDAAPVVPPGYAYGGYEREYDPYERPGYGPGSVPGAGYFVAPGLPGLGLDGPGYGYNGY